MSSFGVLSTGFVRKTVQDILDSIEAGEKSAFGSDINVEADSVLGQLNGVIGGAIAEAWEMGEAVYSSQYPNSSNDASLDSVASITGTVRLAATKSTSSITCTGDAGTILSAGRVVSHVTTGDRFVSDADATLVLTAVWAITTAYVIGDRVSNSGNVYICVVAGTSAGAGGPSGEGSGIVDGTVTWDFVGNGLADVDVAFTAEEFGPTAGPAAALSEIETPVVGWDSARNLLDATLGTDLETDAAFRQRRQENLAVQGSGTLEAIRADILTVPGVVSAFVFENASEFTDGDGRPPHSIEVSVLTTTGDTPDAIIDQAIADKIFEVKGAGIETFGFPGAIVTKTVVDSIGTSHTINWSRIEEIEIYADTTIVTNSDISLGPVYPADGDDQAKAAIVARGNQLVAGEDVIFELMKCQSFQVSGVTDITSFFIDTSASPVGVVNIPITARQVARFDTSRITVTS